MLCTKKQHTIRNRQTHDSDQNKTKDEIKISAKCPAAPYGLCGYLVLQTVWQGISLDDHCHLDLLSTLH